jgi:hypothetical protein
VSENCSSAQPMAVVTGRSTAKERKDMEGAREGIRRSLCERAS